MTEYSPTQIEGSVQKLAKKIEDEYGFDTDITVFFSGNTHWGDTKPSYVELIIKTDRRSFSRRFICYGYSATWSFDISTANGLKEAKKEFMNDFENKLLRYG